MRLPWQLRGQAWRRWHVHYCNGCMEQFSDDEPGSIKLGDDRFPRLCRCPGAPNARIHVNCGMSGPYCPSCAARISAEQAELDELDELEKNWM